jgi:hypothetical protein
MFFFPRIILGGVEVLVILNLLIVFFNISYRGMVTFSRGYSLPVL